MKTVLVALCIMFMAVLCFAEGKPKGYSDKPRQSLEKKLNKIIIPVIEFYQANINDAASDISKAARDADPHKKGVNIVLLDRGNQHEINIERTNISLYDVLKLVSKATGTPLNFDDQTVFLGTPQSK